jgi:hypothetical protein
MKNRLRASRLDFSTTLTRNGADLGSIRYISYLSYLKEGECHMGFSQVKAAKPVYNFPKRGSPKFCLSSTSVRLHATRRRLGARHGVATWAVLGRLSAPCTIRGNDRISVMKKRKQMSRRKEMDTSHGIFPGKRSPLFPGESPSIPVIPVARPNVSLREGEAPRIPVISVAMYLPRKVKHHPANGHTILNALVPIRTPKLSSIGPCQYQGGRPLGNTWCHWLLRNFL